MAERPDAPVLPARVTTPLLDLITQQSFDEDYELVAEQRRAGTRPPARGSGRGRLAVVVLAVFGLLVAVAAAQTARNAGVASAGREQLISRITDRREVLADLRDRIARLQTVDAAAESAARSLNDRLGSALVTRGRLLPETGFGMLEGKGVRAVVDDSADGSADGQVRDDDLALLVNGLWQAGARGIALNGQRVTALSAPRNSGEVIRINGVSLSPPYTVEAVGDTRTLQAGLADSTSGAQFLDVAHQYGMKVTMDNVGKLMLPAAPERMMTVREARSGTSKQTKPRVNQEESQ